MLKKVKEDFSFSDERGCLVQLVHEGFTQINVLKSCKGSYRGGHYHKVAKERFYVVEGTVDVTLYPVGDPQACERYTFADGDMFEIDPCVVHSMAFPIECTMVAMYDVGVEHLDGVKDIYKP